MPQRRSRFLTIVFSCLPGAGHMFMGFMKIGLSLMVSFFLIIFLSSWLGLGSLMYIIPILCFYSFFDCIGKCYASDDEFARFEDHYLFSFDKISDANVIFNGKGRLVVGILILLIGVDMLIKSIVYGLISKISSELYSTILEIMSYLPQLVIGFVIIAIGVYLIIGKKRSIDKNA